MSVSSNDKVDSFKLASLLGGGNFPLAYAYPAEMRATRDHTLFLVRSIAGVGKILALVILYEIHDINRFPRKRKYNKGKALGIFAHKLGRTIYFMLKNKEAFDMKRFFAE